MHLVLIIAVIIILIGLQIRILKIALNKTNELENIFSSDLKSYKVLDVYIPNKELASTTDDMIQTNLKEYKNKGNSTKSHEKTCWDALGNPYTEKETIITCHAKDKEKISIIDFKYISRVTNEIRRVLNNYLIRNKGAASDYALIKDVVERNCNSLEQEIDTQTPWPLYFGLMGTMLGIIFGIGYISLFVGFDIFVEEPEKYIGSLMGDVAMAMIVSCCGICMTTYLSSKAKDSKTILEDRKNKFYSWFQSELMPIITKENASSEIQRLESNLSKFNKTFSSNTKQLGEVFKDVEKTSGHQAELLKALEKMDLKKMATANVAILTKFNETVVQLDKFNDFIDGVKKALFELEVRNQGFIEVVNKTDTVLNDTFEQIKKSIDTQVQALVESVNKASTCIDDLVENEQKHIENQARQIQAHYNTVEDLKPIINGLSDWKKELSRQNAKIGELSEAIRTIPKPDGKGGVVVEKQKEKTNFILLGITIAMLVFLGVNAFFAYRTNKTMSVLSESIEQQKLSEQDTTISETQPAQTVPTVSASQTNATTTEAQPAQTSNTPAQQPTGAQSLQAGTVTRNGGSGSAGH